eukprot:s3169_g7.t1
MGVACGYAHSMAVTDTGNVWAWGLQSGGRLALNVPFEGKFCPIPQKVHPSWKLVEKQPPGRGGEKASKSSPRTEPLQNCLRGRERLCSVKSMRKDSVKTTGLDDRDKAQETASTRRDK